MKKIFVFLGLLAGFNAGAQSLIYNGDFIKHTEQRATMKQEVLVSPNPVEQGTADLQLNINAPAGKIEVTIADYLGRQYINQRFDIREDGEHILFLEVGKANLAPGIYLLRVNGVEKPSSQVLIVK